MSVRYVTVKMIAEHTGLAIKSVRAAIKRRNVKVEKFGGKTGIRVPERVANDFIRKEWPDKAEMKVVE
jgi:hypothetical protein